MRYDLIDVLCGVVVACAVVALLERPKPKPQPRPSRVRIYDAPQPKPQPVKVWDRSPWTVFIDTLDLSGLG